MKKLFAICLLLASLTVWADPWPAIPASGGGGAAPVVLVSSVMDFNISTISYTVPAGTNIFINTSNYVSSTFHLTLPASPANGQLFTFYSGPAQISALSLLGNGSVILGPQTVNIAANSSIEYAYSTGVGLTAVTGWIPRNVDAFNLADSFAGSSLVGTTYNATAGWDFKNQATSTDYTIGNLAFEIQSSSGTSQRFWAGVTADTTNTTLYTNTWGGAYGTINNSHLGQGAGSTNDAQVEYELGVTQSSFQGGTSQPPGYVGAPGGAGVWLTHRNAPLYIGRQAGYYNGGGMDIIVDLSGNVYVEHPLTLAGYTVATLPAGTIGMKAYVTDAMAPTYLGALVGGGAVKCSVFFNGTAWVAD